MATHSSILAQRIPQTEEPGGTTVHGVAKSQTQLSDSVHTGVCALETQEAAPGGDSVWWCVARGKGRFQQRRWAGHRGTFGTGGTGREEAVLPAADLWKRRVQSYKSSSLLALNILTIFLQMLGNHTH